jgi:small subunit ribosomal protein S16
MAVKIRLQRHGRKKAPFYHIVIADARAPRDGKFIEKIGTYNPMTVPATIDINRDAAYSWLTKGAQPTDTVAAILRFKGVMFRKHLMRGVAKGSMTEEQAMEKYNAFLETKEKKVSDRFAQTIENKKKVREQVFGTPKAPKVKEVPAPEVVEEVVEAVVVEEAPVAEVVEAPVAEVVETVVVEAPVAEVVEAPVAEVVEAVAAPEVVEAPAEVVAEVPNVAAEDPEVAAMEAAAEGEEPAA